MGLRGPAPKKKATAKFRSGIPPAPDWMDAAGKKEYRRAVTELKEAGVDLCQMDMAIVATYSQSYADFARLSRKIRKEGEVTQGNQGPVTNPRIRAMAQARQAMCAASAKLGFSPVDRQRVPAASKPQQGSNEFAEI